MISEDCQFTQEISDALTSSSSNRISGRPLWRDLPRQCPPADLRRRYGLADDSDLQKRITKIKTSLDAEANKIKK